MTHPLISCVTKAHCTSRLNQSATLAGSPLLHHCTLFSLYAALIDPQAGLPTGWESRACSQMCSPAESCQEPQTDTKPEETHDEFYNMQEVVNQETFRYILTSIYFTSTPLTLDWSSFWLSQQSLNQNQDLLRPVLMQSSAWASLSLTLQHCLLRIKARDTQDIQPYWLSLTPLMWTAEAVEPRLARMMKFPLYLYPHATPHRCRYESSPSIYSKWEQGRWILMHPCWPPHKHCYIADHVAPLTYTWNI